MTICKYRVYALVQRTAYVPYIVEINTEEHQNITDHARLACLAVKYDSTLEPENNNIVWQRRFVSQHQDDWRVERVDS